MGVATELLKIQRPEGLFLPKVTEIKKKHRELAKEWHPDVNGNPAAGVVFQHLTYLYEKALDKLAFDYWGFEGLMKFRSKKGAGWDLKYRARHRFELGEFYVADNVVVYLIEGKHKKLVDNALGTIDRFRYPSDKVREEVSRYLPRGAEVLNLDSDWLAVGVKKTPDLLLLKDVLRHYGTLDPKHIAWIQSSLHNLSCYLWVSKLTHNDISLDTYFISPQHHSGALLGGWWYAKPVGEKLEQVPKRTFDYLPWEVRNTKKASRLTDQELVRLVGRELLGSGDAPAPMQEWFKSVASEGAVEAYDKWMNEVLPSSFGKRRFTKMDLDVETLYNS